MCLAMKEHEFLQHLALTSHAHSDVKAYLRMRAIRDKCAKEVKKVLIYFYQLSSHEIKDSIVKLMR